MIQRPPERSLDGTTKLPTELKRELRWEELYLDVLISETKIIYARGVYKPSKILHLTGAVKVLAHTSTVPANKLHDVSRRVGSSRRVRLMDHAWYVGVVSLDTKFRPGGHVVVQSLARGQPHTATR
jgi:hypothetical protein